MSDNLPARESDETAEDQTDADDGNLPAEQDEAPHRTGGGIAGAATGVLNFIVLASRITLLTAEALRLKEGMSALQRHMDRNADKASTLSEMCHQAEVEEQFTAQIMEVSAALHRVAAASGELADTADQMESHARGFNNAHETEYRGIYEATKTGPRQPKPGFNRVR